MKQPDYVTCSCQHCGGHIKFDASQMRKGEAMRIECPHCHKETSLSRPPENKSQGGTKPELFFFGLTRSLALVGAVLVFAAFVFVVISLLVSMRPELPKKPRKPETISYKKLTTPEPAAAPVTRDIKPGSTPSGAKIAGQNAFPQPVVDFLLLHHGFSLKGWLNQIKPAHREAFLDNLAEILVSAKADDLTKEESEQLVKDFANAWFEQNEKNDFELLAIQERAEKNLQKKVLQTTLISSAVGLFATLISLTLILVLLAVERNTRLILQKE